MHFIKSVHWLYIMQSYNSHLMHFVPFTAPTFKGKLSVVETLGIPPVLLPPSPPKRSNELPPGLKQRFMPFGWGELFLNLK